MLEYLKTQAQSQTYNKGWKLLFKLYDEIAEDPGKILLACEIICQIDEERGRLVEGMKCTLRETLDAMDYMMDKKYDSLCTIYEEYKGVPTKEMFDAEEKGRASRHVVEEKDE